MLKTSTCRRSSDLRREKGDVEESPNAIGSYEAGGAVGGCVSGYLSSRVPEFPTVYVDELDSDEQMKSKYQAG